MENTEKQGTIAKIEFKSQFKKADGKTIYYHNVWFEDKTEGQAVLDSQEPTEWGTGKTVKYRVFQNENGIKFYPVREKKASGRGFDPVAEERRQKMIARQSSLKVAFDYLMAQNKAFSPAELMSMADLFTDYVMKP